MIAVVNPYRKWEAGSGTVEFHSFKPFVLTKDEVRILYYRVLGMGDSLDRTIDDEIAGADPKNPGSVDVPEDMLIEGRKEHFGRIGDESRHFLRDLVGASGSEAGHRGDKI